MKGLPSIFFLTLLVCASGVAQDSTMPQPSSSMETTAMPDSSGPAARPMNTPASMPDTASSGMPSTHKTYSSEGYGHRAEIFLAAFGLLGNQPSGNAITQQMTNAGGGAAGYRFHLNSRSALEGRYGFSRNSQKYTIGGVTSSIPAYFSEISGSYVYSFGNSQRIRPFLEGGGGVVLFSPGNYGTARNTTNVGTVGTTDSGIPAGYALPAFHAQDILAPVYTGSSAGVGSQAKGMFLYGAGLGLTTFSHFSFRTEFRGLGYKAPDFGLNALQTNALSFSYEPTVGVAYRF